VIFCFAVGRPSRRQSYFAALLPLIAICSCAFFAAAQAPAPQQSPPPQQQPQSQPQKPAAPPTIPPPIAQLPSAHPIFIVVLDPGHGGTDTGARGSSGAVEKDLTLEIARAVRTQLLQQGFHAIMTRDSDDNPSFDDRAALANAQRNAVLVSFHVSSTGQPGTARAYSYLFSTNEQAPAESAADSAPGDAPPHPASRLTPWETAQQAYAVASHRLADMIQSELAQKLSGSPAASTAFAVRDLRSVAAPAVAVELSSVSVQDPHTLDPIITTLASCVTRAVIAFHSTYAAGAR
jgi:N-acetylmuramoyl-L-alanine amidase